MLAPLISAGVVCIAMLVARRELEQTPWLLLGAVPCMATVIAFLVTGDIGVATCMGALATACAVIAAVDARKMIVPDALVLTLGAVAYVAPFRPAAMEQIVGAIVLGALFVGVRAAHYWVRRAEGLGLGDVKLAIMSGALLGAQGALAATAAAAILTAMWMALWARRYAPAGGGVMSVEAPFGVGLSAALFVGSVVRVAAS